eukprot:CAMPEP_0115161218 /NCGR_PEP_ID=MMETSP0227-20121206/71225_1 /TAXON_ID=89957 /ORGANISM="Polarella glacialis, Strain CCMP 1383" /LENGTH=67 /DNA_ID=CAMNT_0002573175 /DNA_START=175 /DNA_END=377 /DNA_ORIENTATION=-
MVLIQHAMQPVAHRLASPSAKGSSCTDVTAPVGARRAASTPVTAVLPDGPYSREGSGFAAERLKGVA